MALKQIFLFLALIAGIVVQANMCNMAAEPIFWHPWFYSDQSAMRQSNCPANQPVDSQIASMMYTPDTGFVIRHPVGLPHCMPFSRLHMPHVWRLASALQFVVCLSEYSIVELDIADLYMTLF
jgi:hypothetical protein